MPKHAKYRLENGISESIFSINSGTLELMTVGISGTLELGFPLKPTPHCNLHFHSPKGIVLCTNSLLLFY